MAGPGNAERNLDPGFRLVLSELRDLRVEMRADRQRADAERHQADAERRQADAAWRAERRQAEQQWRRELKLMRDESRQFREEMARHAAAMEKAFKEIRAVGFAIVKTLNRHTRILERIDRRLAGPANNGRRGRGNGRGA